MRAILREPGGQHMNLYLYLKVFHLLFVMAWVAAVFYLPRILINIAEAGAQSEVQARLVLMGRRLYRFGHIMFGLAVVLGLVLWLGYRFLPDFPTMVAPGTGWMHAKLGLVLLMLIDYVLAGRWLKGVEQGRTLPPSWALRVFNELPVVVLVVVIWLVIFKPF